MPTYDYRCPACEFTEEVVHSIKESPVIKCGKCSESMERLISFSTGGFIFKSWTESMAYKVNRDKHKNVANLEARQLERYGLGMSLKPNVNGEEVSTWSDASKLAKDKGKNPDSYTPFIEKEKRTSKISGVSDEKWRSIKESK